MLIFLPLAYPNWNGILGLSLSLRIHFVKVKSTYMTAHARKINENERGYQRKQKKVS